MSIDHLYNQKLQKLKEQKNLSDQMNELLTKSGGFNDSQRMTIKSINAAIAVAKQPGYFEYYETPHTIKTAEQNNVLNNIVKNIEKVSRELDDINNEITQHNNKTKNDNVVPTVASLDQWFQIYGKPKMSEDQKELLTTFGPNSKIYGGTKQYKSFKTSANIMKKGRLTR